MNTVIETMVYRRSIRKYKEQQISDGDLSAILTAGLYAPSGGNHQYVRLFVLQNPETLAALNVCVRDTMAGREIIEGQYQNKSIIRARKDGYNFMFNAPTLISAVSLREHGNSMADSANALQNIQVAAKSLDLGACWINTPHWLTDLPELRKFFEPLGMREDEDIFGSVAVGIPDIKPPSPPHRKDGRVTVDRSDFIWKEATSDGN